MLYRSLRSHSAGDALGGIKLNHNPFSAIKQPSADPAAERETDMAQLPSQPQAASGPATELTQDPDVDMLDTENQPDRQAPFLASAPAQHKEWHVSEGCAGATLTASSQLVLQTQTSDWHTPVLPALPCLPPPLNCLGLSACGSMRCVGHGKWC